MVESFYEFMDWFLDRCTDIGNFVISAFMFIILIPPILVLVVINGLVEIVKHKSDNCPACGSKLIPEGFKGFFKCSSCKWPYLKRHKVNRGDN